MSGITIVSLRDTVTDKIGSFLFSEGFKDDGVTVYGILEIINLISDYHEEGNRLFPEIIITSNFKFFDPIPHKSLGVKKANLAVKEFAKALKLCAPLAINGWVIGIEVKDGMISYGLFSSELSETSFSMYTQTVGTLKALYYDDTSAAYIRNIGQKTVELAGMKNKFFVSLTLDEPSNFENNNVQLLAEHITSECEKEYRTSITTFFEKTINEALRTGHGNLIGVVADNEVQISKLKDRIEEKGGVYLEHPMDFNNLIVNFESDKTADLSVQIKLFSSVLRSMLNHDGITILTTKGRLIAYHILIDNFIKDGDQIDSGTRSKAYKSMENCGFFSAAFYKSQDGNSKLWLKK